MLQFNLPLEPTDWWVIGRPENWIYITDKSVPGVDNNRYIVSDYGRAYDLHKNIRCREFDFGGYKTIQLHTISGTHTYLLHRIVLIEFIGMSNVIGYNIVNHKDGIKYCCVLENLEWTTKSGNVQHAFEMNLNTNYGENAMFAKMTDQDALNIMYQLEKGIPVEEIAKTVPDYIESPLEAVYAIRGGRSWKKLARDNNIQFAEYEDKRNRYTEEEKDLIGQCLQQNMDYKSILEYLGYDISSMDKKQLTAHNRSISSIRCGDTSPYIAEKYNLKECCKQNADEIFTIDQLHAACKIFESGFISYDDTLIKLGYNPVIMAKDERFRYVNALSALRRKKNYPKITCMYNF